MKKFFIIMGIVILGLSVYFDLTEGTLTNESTPTNGQAPREEAPSPDQPVQEVIVEPGQTVLSIVEQLHEGPVPVSIEQIAEDFQKLNDGTAPEAIEVDQSYYFPIYESSLFQ